MSCCKTMRRAKAGIPFAIGRLFLHAIETTGIGVGNGRIEGYIPRAFHQSSTVIFRQGNSQMPTLVKPRKKSQRVSANVPKHVKERLEEAAAWRGMSVSEFLISAAVREAEQVIERERLIRLSREDAKLVVSLMTSPPQPG